MDVLDKAADLVTAVVGLAPHIGPEGRGRTAASHRHETTWSDTSTVKLPTQESCRIVRRSRAISRLAFAAASRPLEFLSRAGWMMDETLSGTKPARVTGGEEACGRAAAFR